MSETSRRRARGQVRDGLALLRMSGSTSRGRSSNEALNEEVSRRTPTDGQSSRADLGWHTQRKTTGAVLGVGESAGTADRDPYETGAANHFPRRQ